jgi:hypothetical protein
MGTVKLEVSHTLSKDEAKQRVTKLLEYWSGKYGVKADWSGDAAKMAGKVMGISLSADLEIHANKISGEATDPGFLLRERATKYLRDKLARYLDPTWDGEP